MHYLLHYLEFYALTSALPCFQILKTGNNFKDKGRSDKSCFLFGFGDGGNGPS